MELVNAAKQVPITRTEVGSSLLDTARNPIIGNKTPSPDLPGSKSREKGTHWATQNKGYYVLCPG